MTSWRKTIAVKGSAEAAAELCKVNVIKPAVIKGKKIVKKAVTKS